MRNYYMKPIQRKNREVEVRERTDQHGVTRWRVGIDASYYNREFAVSFIEREAKRGRTIVFVDGASDPRAGNF